MRWGLLIPAGVLLLAACQTTTDGSGDTAPPQARPGIAANGATLTATDMVVDNILKAGVPYTATIKYETIGKGAEILRGCFTWSGEGPYCFKPSSTAAGEATWSLRTGNPNVYRLSGAIEYSSAGETRQTNFVSATIDVQ